MSDTTRRVALDARKLAGGRTGIGQYVRELAQAVPALAPDLSLLLLVDKPIPANQVPDGCQLLVVGGALPAGSPAKLYSPYWMNVLVPRILASQRVQLFHATNYAMPIACRSSAVVTIHDLAFVKTPEAYTAAYRAYARVQLHNAVRRAAAIIVDSRSTESDLSSRFEHIQAPVSVIHLGVGGQYSVGRDSKVLDGIRSELRLPERFMLHVGVVQRRKNLVLLMTVARRLIRDGLLDGVVLAGSEGYGATEVHRAARHLGIETRVTFTGYVPDETAVGLYNLASLTVVPSLYEGFGMTVLEAMACGCPVVSSNVSSLPEVAGDAALLVAPDDVEGWTAALRRVLCDDELRNRLRQQGLERASRFTWRAAAAAHVEVYRKVLESRGRA